MAASMFGAFELTLPSALNNRLAQVGGIGYKGAFVLGLACGLIASPCTGPVLTGILTWIAKTQSAGLGARRDGCFRARTGRAVFRGWRFRGSATEERALDGARQIAARHRADRRCALLPEHRIPRTRDLRDAHAAVSRSCGSSRGGGPAARSRASRFFGAGARQSHGERARHRARLASARFP